MGARELYYFKVKIVYMNKNLKTFNKNKEVQCY